MESDYENKKNNNKKNNGYRRVWDFFSGSVTRFVGILFHESNPPGPLMDSLKRFCLMIHFRLDIRILSSKNTTTGSVCQRGVEICWEVSPLKS